MTRPVADLRKALRAAGRLPHGLARCAATEQVVAEIDAADAVGLLPRALHHLINAYYGSEEPEKAFVPFSRALRLYDDRPELFAADDEGDRVMWSFKWILDLLPKFPTVPAARIEQVLDDMERRYALFGLGSRPVWFNRWWWAIYRGDRAPALDLADRFTAAHPSRFDDSASIIVNAWGHHFALVGDDEEVVGVLRPVLEGRPAGGTDSSPSLADAMLPLLRLGRFDEARDAHLRALRSMPPGMRDQYQVGQHLEFLAVTGNEARGLELIAERGALRSAGGTPWTRQWFLNGAGLLLRRVVDLGAGDTPVDGPDGPTTAADLAGRVRDEAFALAAAFDARNGTDHVTSRTKQTLAAEPLVDHLPLDRTAG